jgi:Tfp pilus assembly protein PilN
VTGRARQESRSQRHGNIFSPHSGSMYVHVQRENGLAHHTLWLRPWQVQALRVLTSRWFLIALGVGLASWGYFAIEAARVPVLNWRISQLEQDAQRIDSLQKTLTLLQTRYEQVQRMLSVPAAPKAATQGGAVEHTHP